MKSAKNSKQYSLSLKSIRGIYGIFLVAISCVIIHPKSTVSSLETKIKGFYFQKEQTGGILGVERGMQTLGKMSRTYKNIKRKRLEKNVRNRL